MDLLLLVFAAGISLPTFIFGFCFKELIKYNLAFIIGGGVIGLFGICLYITSNEENKIMYLSLLTTLYAAILYRIMWNLFVKWFGREPEDTIFKYHVKFPDAMFGILYGILITVIPLYLFWFIWELYITK
ncbi:hypothetical protein [Aquimarina aquimarini]|uniref:hypothetical protein n=1 Tax=Aquimarina aquimarini TaxID=1191734 RepID=UPI001F2646D7|nr:hypothetical protein [Aquimarina aquimarini]